MNTYRQYYETIKSGCYNQVSPDWPAGTVLCTLNPNCIRDAAKWESIGERINWEGLLDSRNNLQCRHFEVAVISDDVLVGLAFGRVSKGKRIVRIDYIQRHPECNHLKSKFVPLVIELAATYARALGAKAVKITEPNKTMVNAVLSVISGARFCSRDVYYPYDHLHIDI